MEGKKNRWGWLPAIALAALLAYPLSIGPAVWLRLSIGSPPWFDAIADTFYTPLIWARDISPPCVLDWWNAYQGWWAGWRLDR